MSKPPPALKSTRVQNVIRLTGHSTFPHAQFARIRRKTNQTTFTSVNRTEPNRSDISQVCVYYYYSGEKRIPALKLHLVVVVLILGCNFRAGSPTRARKCQLVSESGRGAAPLRMPVMRKLQPTTLFFFFACVRAGLTAKLINHVNGVFF